MPRTVLVHDRMQQGYRYALTAPAGRGFDPAFRPELTPAEMLRLGVFGGKYMTDCRERVPGALVRAAPSSPPAPAIRRSTSSASTRASRCRCGAPRAGSTPTIRAAGSSGIAATTWAAAWPTTRARSGAGGRSAAMSGQIERHCEKGDLFCRPRQRQALLHWAYDSRLI